ncbi:hypothetical protein [Burkholderia pseudomallei]|uniref:hypothetical protein n=1 Tax=Burkholderia pseudomallei TaxID=28450 RepID=UPI00052AB8A3|nr:hypothetical protein [Burkholderia pseudomallei]AIV63113.1 hypothetical protein X993_3353 [Burkholderia pseudomallei K42]
MSWYLTKSTSPFEKVERSRLLECAREFINSPSQRPLSPDVQRLLNRFHGRRHEGRLVLAQLAPGNWCLAQLQGRGRPLQLFRNQRYASLDDGERAIFRLWWKDETGEELPF